MSYGDQFNQAKAQWESRSIDDRLRERGISRGMNESGAYEYTQEGGPDGAARMYGEDGGGPDGDKLAAFDANKWFFDNGLISDDPRYRHYGEGDSGITADSMARSYKFKDAQDMYSHMTGAGKFVDDPVLGRYWEPTNHNAQSWDTNFIGQQNAANMDFINGLGDSGAIVKMMMGAVLGPAIGAATGASGAAGGSMFSSLPSWAGGAAELGAGSLGGGMAGAGLGGASAGGFGSALGAYGATGAGAASGLGGVGSDYFSGFDGDPSWGVNARSSGMGDDLTNWFDEVGTTDGETFSNVPASTGNPADYANNLSWLQRLMQSGNGTSTGAQTLLKLLTGGGSGASGGEISKLLGNLLSTGVGLYGADKNRSATNAMFDKFYGAGAPSRARFESSFTPGFTMENDPGYMDALNQSSKATLHGLSVQGNPAGSPNAWAQSLKDNYEKTAYPALKDYRSSNASAGGLAAGANTAGTLATTALKAGNNGISAVGNGLADIFNPKQDDDILSQIMKRYGGTNPLYTPS